LLIFLGTSLFAMSAVSSKRAVIAGSPLEHSGVLRQMFSYFGFGHWLYFVPVCKRWHAEYTAFVEQLLDATPHPYSHRYCDEHAADCATVTLWRAAFSSAECLKIAVAGGLRLLAPADCFWQEKYKFEQLQKQLAQFGSRDLLLHARHQYNVPWSELLCAGAAQSGDLSKLQWLHMEQQCPWYVGAPCFMTAERNVAICAERGGNGMAILHWLKEEGVAMPSLNLAIFAAAYGRLSMQFLESEGCTFEKFRTPCMNAALNGQLEVLQWLHERGAPLMAGIGENAAKSGSVPVLTWLAEVLPPHDNFWSARQLTAMLQTAGSFGSLEACVWLRQQGAEWPDSLIGYGTEGWVAWKQCVLEWARANGCTTEHPGFADHDSEFPKVRGVLHILEREKKSRP
jgi:hypothetical protein